MTGVPRAFQKLQRTKKKGEQCKKTHCLSHLKTQLGENIVIPSLISTHFVCWANNRETNRSPPCFIFACALLLQVFLILLTSSYMIGATFTFGFYQQDPDGVEQAGNLTLQNPPITHTHTQKLTRNMVSKLKILIEDNILQVYCNPPVAPFLFGLMLRWGIIQF